MEKKIKILKETMQDALAGDLVEHVVLPYFPKCTECSIYLTEVEDDLLKKKGVSFLLCHDCQQECVAEDCTWRGAPQEFVQGLCPNHNPDPYEPYSCNYCRARYWWNGPLSEEEDSIKRCKDCWLLRELGNQLAHN
jgi:hypothetical protein